MRLSVLRWLLPKARCGPVIGTGAQHDRLSGSRHCRLIEKRRELTGIIIDELQRQLDQHRADLTHIDGVLRVLATDIDPETIRPKRAYRQSLLRAE
jgi:hypothetical protein